ncbi:MAG: hypothetical protein IKQ33_02710 [Clostridia bacterium]|nr:hypothetical protein [Clostridia bacterium]
MKANELLEILSQQWCSLNDLMKICKCVKNKALIVKNRFKKELLEEGYIIPSRSLPMKAVVDKLKIDIDYLEKMSKIQK